MAAGLRYALPTAIALAAWGWVVGGFVPSPWLGAVLIACGVLYGLSPLLKEWNTAHPRVAPFARAGLAVVIGIASIQTATWIWTRPTPPAKRIYIQLDRVPEAYARGATSLESDQLARRFVGDWVQLDGTVANVRNDFYLWTVDMTLPNKQTVAAVFRAEYADRIKTLSVHDPVKAECEITSILPGGAPVVENCEFR